MQAKEIAAAFIPTRTVSKNAIRIIAVAWAALTILWWTFLTSPTVPKPLGIITAVGELWTRGGLVEDVVVSLWLNAEAIFWSSAISLGLAAFAVLPGMRPLVVAVSKLRFLGLTGLTFLFGLAMTGHALKLWLVVFGMTVFLATSMAAVVAEIPREQYDLARTIRMGPWRTVYEVVMRGTADQMLELIRQNAAIGWVMLTMVEGIVRAEGGLGALLLTENKHFKLEAVFAVQLLILVIGLCIDYGLGLVRMLLCPYAYLNRGPASSTKRLTEVKTGTVPHAPTRTAMSIAPPAPVPHIEAAPSYEYSFGESLLQLEGIGLTLGDNLVLKGVSATVYDVKRPGLTQGQVVSLLGPSGIGKTQLFRILAGFNKPDEGVVRVNENGLMVPVEPGKVGVVSQHYTLFMHRSVSENLRIAGKMAKLSSKETEEKMADLLEKFELTDKAEKYPAELSGGQRQRIAIVQQLMCSGDLLLMDEPFSGLDPIMKVRACDMIAKVAALSERTTIVVVTHDIGAAMQVGDTVWMMGRDRDDQGQAQPGARIKETVDLMARGLAWRPGISKTPLFHDIREEIYNKFFSL